MKPQPYSINNPRQSTGTPHGVPAVLGCRNFFFGGWSSHPFPISSAPPVLPIIPVLSMCLSMFCFDASMLVNVLAKSKLRGWWGRSNAACWSLAPLPEAAGDHPTLPLPAAGGGAGQGPGPPRHDRRAAGLPAGVAAPPPPPGRTDKRGNPRRGQKRMWCFLGAGALCTAWKLQSLGCLCQHVI